MAKRLLESSNISIVFSLFIDFIIHRKQGRGCRDGPVGKVLAMEARGLELKFQSP